MVESALTGFRRIDRVSFRAKTVESFLGKAGAVRANGEPKYGHPLETMEDLIGGRVLVHFRDDMRQVRERLVPSLFRVLEDFQHEPEKPWEFSYESRHIIAQIPTSVEPEGWSSLDERPMHFELQIRTLQMHASAEPTHEPIYKNTSRDSALEKKAAWVAASAWGADQILEEIRRQADSEPN